MCKSFIALTGTLLVILASLNAYAGKKDACKPNEFSERHPIVSSNAAKEDVAPPPSETSGGVDTKRGIGKDAR